MNPKEKAKELVEKFIPFVDLSILPESTNTDEFESTPMMENSKQCALICVEEILNYSDAVSSISGVFHRHSVNGNYVDADIENEWWRQVKTEIEKL